MKKKVIAATTASVFVLAGCADLTEQEQAAIFGAGAGAIVAQAFDAKLGGTVISAAAGAAAGSLIAQNTRTNQCAYADGKGGHTTRSC